MWPLLDLFARALVAGLLMIGVVVFTGLAIVVCQAVVDMCRWVLWRWEARHRVGNR